MKDPIIEEIEQREKISQNVARAELKIKIMEDLTNFARRNNQVVGEKNDFYITLEQLENFLKSA